MTSAHLLAYAVVAGFMLIGFLAGYIMGGRSMLSTISKRTAALVDRMSQETPVTPRDRIKIYETSAEWSAAIRAKAAQETPAAARRRLTRYKALLELMLARLRRQPPRGMN